MSKLLLITLITLGGQQAVPKQACNCPSATCKQFEAIKAIEAKLQQYYKQLPANTPKPAVKQLAPKLYQGWLQYRLHPDLSMRVIAVESAFNIDAYNKHSDDWGLMQIHGSTARLMHVNKNCLRQWPCNLSTGLQILAAAQRRKAVCRYNLGSKPLTGKRAKACKHYEQKLIATNI